MNESKKFPGQPILSQILDVISASLINAANTKHKANRYYKRLPLGVHLVSLLYGYSATVMGYGSYMRGYWPVKESCPTWDWIKRQATTNTIPDSL